MDEKRKECARRNVRAFFPVLLLLLLLLFIYFLNLAQKFSVQTIFKIKNIFKKYVCLHLSASFFLG
jgi:hypothetical protein